MFTQKETNSFLEAVDSLKKYRRADLLDDNGISILENLYVDLLPGDIVLKNCLFNNTTFLIGRKGTGKSTIFLKMEMEYRKMKHYIPCYIDVKTVYESSRAEPINLPYLSEFFSEDKLKQYLLERTFIQSVLKRIYEEIDNIEQNFFEKLKNAAQRKSKKEIKNRIDILRNKITNNDCLNEDRNTDFTAECCKKTREIRRGK